MQQFNGGRLFVHITGLSNMAHSTNPANAHVIPISNHEDIKSNIDFVCAELARIELPHSLASATELRKIIHNESEIKTSEELQLSSDVATMSERWSFMTPLVLGRYRYYAGDLTNRFKDELASRVVLAIAARHSAYFSAETPLFGDEVFAKFERARDDIEEAGKCLACGRATATVFHLMRALESAVRIIGTKLGATTEDVHGRGLAWGVVAGNMRPIIDAMPVGSDQQTKWYRVQQDLVAVNRAWRVPTNHPKETYTEEQAQEVFDATRAFMRELAPLV